MTAKSVDFRELAKTHIARGFSVAATKPASKEGVHGWHLYNQLFEEQQVDTFLVEHPECANSNVAVCGSCDLHYRKKDSKVVRDKDGNKILEGNHFFLDIDAEKK